MFSKKTTAVTATKSSNTKSLFASNKRMGGIIFIGILMYVLLIAGGLAVFWQYSNYKNQQSRNAAVSDEWVPTEYSEMDDVQITVKLYKDTGYSPSDFFDNKPDKKMLPSFAKAYSAAQAMYYLGHYDKALELYAFADTYNSKDKLYSFYFDYAKAAQTADNNEIFYKQIDATKTAIRNDKKLTDDAKTSLIDNIDVKLKLMERDGQ